MNLNLFSLNETSTLSFLFRKMNEGGSVFMYTLMAILILIVYLFIYALTKKKINQKLISQINSISLFALVFGFLGQIFGMIQVFDAIEFGGNISPAVLGGGIKITALSPSFGMLVFLTGRLGTIMITAFKK
jgi:uncharacterized membrane protein YjfL (UPF0719 family)